MRRALLVLLILAVAGPAVGGQATIPAQPKPGKLAAPIQAPIAAPSFVLPAPIPLASARPAGDTQQCKATCSKTLYFCQSGGDDDGCAGRWAQCSASCTATYAPVRFGR